MNAETAQLTDQLFDVDPAPVGYVPVLNLRNFTHGDAALRQRFVEQLRDAAHRVGVFYLRGFGARPSQANTVLQAARVFFGLSDEKKRAIHMSRSPHFRGYTAAGDEITRGQRDWREQLDVGAERSPLPQTSDSPAWTRLQGPNQWPEGMPTLRPIVLDWQDTLTQSAQQLLRALALALGLPESQFSEPFSGSPVQHLKIIRYPGRRAQESRQGVGPHKDSGCITMLLQDANAGLQVLERQNTDEPRWVDVPPLPDSVVVNLGEVLEILSNGYLRATTHRVLSPPCGMARLSVAFFLSPRLDASLPVLELPPALAANARGVDQDPLNPLIPHTGRNLLKGRLRSHPEVAQNFYADVIGGA